MRYLISITLKSSASQVSPHVLSLLVPYPNIPDEPPKVAVAFALRLWGVVWFGLHVAGLFLLSRGFSFVGSPLRARCGVLYSGTLSARDVGLSTPLGHSPVFSHVRRVYLVDSFITRDPQYNAHTTSLILTLSGHTFSG